MHTPLAAADAAARLADAPLLVLPAAARQRATTRILLALIAEFARDGLTFASALDLCPELLVDQAS